MKARSLASVIATVATIAAAALVWHSLPVNTQVYAPFDTHGTAGSAVVGGDLTATVTATGISTKLLSRTSAKEVGATGTWVVVTTTLQTGRAPALPHAELLVGGDTYATTDRLIAGAGLLQAGIPQDRQWTFDVAPEVLNSVSSVVLRMWTGDGRLDARLLIDIPLAGADRPASIVLTPSTVVM